MVNAARRRNGSEIADISVDSEAQDEFLHVALPAGCG
jgi:hypothetical protein